MSNESVIDNDDVVLLDQLRLHLPSATRASIAVGYFFISGFAAIMDSFAKIEQSGDPGYVIRLLISPVTNKPTAEALLASNESLEYAERSASASTVDGKDTARRQVRDSLGHMPQSGQDGRAVAKLVDLVRKKKLQVRVYTREQLHAKAYIFELDNPQLPRMSIVGSSNLSISGIRENTELNLRTNIDDDSKKLLKWFDRHWEDSEEFTEEMAEIIGGSWVRQRKPEDVYRKAVLHEHGRIQDIEIDDAGAVELFDFQKMAVAGAISKLEEYGGVIIADVVGTGKSYIGSMLLRYLKDHNRSKPLIICPPHLKSMWEEYMEMFDIDARVLSRYKIGMEGNVLSKYTSCDVVLVDESHNFRNTNNSYNALHAFMKEQPDDSYIIMLTATPISNSINDLKNQLELFPADCISNVPALENTSLKEYFKGAEKDHIITPDGEGRIRELLRHVLIRRTRRQIQDNFAKKDGERYYLESGSGRKYFPRRNLENPKEYDMDMVYQNSFEKIQEYVGMLKLARYAPGHYIREEYRSTTHPHYRKYDDLAKSMLSLAGIVRTVLLKRMESSIAAFASSVSNYSRGSAIFLGYLKDGTVPIGKDYQDMIYKSIMSDGDGYDDGEPVPVPGRPAYDIGAFDVDAWKADIVSDIAMFESMLRLLPKRDKFTKHDDKLHTLLDILESRRGQKVLVFTESRVTAEYIHGYLSKKMPGIRMGQIDSAKSSKEKNVMIRRFDPANNHAADMPVEDQLDVIISTDVLSEGVNLQAGKAVINYDFHWNPVRLIQRVGRIDRIGSEHEVVDVINFLPATKVESRLHLRERVAGKIETIRKIIGHDQKILEETEAIDKDAVIDIYAGDDGVLDGGRTDGFGGILDMVQTRAEIDAEQISGDGALRDAIESLPLGIRGATGSEKLLVACEADERTLLDGAVIGTKVIRRHYVVENGAASRTTASAFLRAMGQGRMSRSVPVGDDHTAMLGTAWKTFSRDVKNEQARTTQRSVQKYFEKKLRNMAGDQNLGRRAQVLIPSIRQMMVLNKQPYRGLADLRKRINREDPDDSEILERLEHILEKRYEYRKDIGKPRVLYSMGVRS